MQLYWITRLDGINNLILGVGIILVVLFLVACSALGEAHKNETSRQVADCATLLLIGMVITAITYTFTPTTKEMAAIMVVPRIANSEKVQEVGGKLYDLAVEWMDELKPKHKANQ